MAVQGESENTSDISLFSCLIDIQKEIEVLEDHLLGRHLENVRISAEIISKKCRLMMLEADRMKPLVGGSRDRS